MTLEFHGCCGPGAGQGFPISPLGVELGLGRGKTKRSRRLKGVGPPSQRSPVPSRATGTRASWEVSGPEARSLLSQKLVCEKAGWTRALPVACGVSREG